jgi:hypothetical protein
MRNCWSFFSTFIYEKVGRGYANQSKASRAEKPWSLTRRVARNRKPHTHMRKLKPWSLATGVARNQSRTRTTTYTRKTKAVVPCNRSRTHHQAAPVQTRTRATQRPWSLSTGVARIIKPSKHAKQSPSTFLKWRVDVVS